ncbi:MAG: hypothetical protein GWN32_10905, partial [Gemmatimonadetes bacterium]|nr:hypothetical protein [Gemmatimonadota bacterium]
VGELDPDYVDAYYGPPAWRSEAENAVASAGQLKLRATALIERIGEIAKPTDPMGALRHTYLGTQLAAVASRLDMLQGTRL